MDFNRLIDSELNTIIGGMGNLPRDEESEQVDIESRTAMAQVFKAEFIPYALEAFKGCRDEVQKIRKDVDAQMPPALTATLGTLENFTSKLQEIIISGAHANLQYALSYRYPRPEERGENYYMGPFNAIVIPFNGLVSFAEMAIVKCGDADAFPSLEKAFNTIARESEGKTAKLASGLAQVSRNVLDVIQTQFAKWPEYVRVTEGVEGLPKKGAILRYNVSAQTSECV